MTVIEASEILKKYMYDGYIQGLEDGDNPHLALVFDGAYDEDEEGYVFAVYFTKDGKPDPVDKSSFAFWIDNATGEVTCSDAPGNDYSSFPKKIDVAWTTSEFAGGE